MIQKVFVALYDDKIMGEGQVKTGSNSLEPCLKLFLVDAKNSTLHMVSKVGQEKQHRP